MLDPHDDHIFIFNDTTFDQLTEVAIASAGADLGLIETRTILSVQAEEMTIDAGVFACRAIGGDRTRVAVVQDANGLTITSDAPADGNVLTDNESAVLVAILRRDELGVFYRPALRDQQLRQAAVAYGLEHEPDLERYFVPKLAEGRLVVQPRIPGLLPLSSTKLRALGSGATGCALPPGAVKIGRASCRERE